MMCAPCTMLGGRMIVGYTLQEAVGSSFSRSMVASVLFCQVSEAMYARPVVGCGTELRTALADSLVRHENLTLHLPIR